MSIKKKKIVLSALLVVRNEEERLEKALKSLSFCDEIVIVDQQSTDRTLETARKYTDKVYHDKVRGYADPSRKLAAQKCSGEWLFILDADEIVTPELAREISYAIRKNPQFHGYEIHRRNWYMGGWIDHIGKNDFIPRLLQKKHAKFSSKIHVCFDMKGPLGRLKGRLLHYPPDDLNSQLEKMHRYAKIEANAGNYKGFWRRYFGVFVIPPAYFFYHYFYQLGFLDRLPGFFYALQSVYYHLLIYRYIFFR